QARRRSGRLAGWRGWRPRAGLAADGPGQRRGRSARRHAVGPRGACPARRHVVRCRAAGAGVRLRRTGAAGRVTDPISTRLLGERDAALAQLAALGREYDAMVAASEASNADDEHDPEGAT